MARLLLLVILYAIPPLVVPIHNSSAGGNFCVLLTGHMWNSVCVFAVCVCLLCALMDGSKSAKTTKWPEWRAVICAIREVSVKLQQCYFIWIQDIPSLLLSSFFLPSLFFLLFFFSFLFFFQRLRHHPASQGRWDPLQRPDTRAGTEDWKL